MKSDLSILEHCEVRKVWDNEVDFSDWLYREENLSLLCDSLGIDEIQDATREDSVGSFRADIFGETNDARIIIENQFESSNHEHLGKIITYAAGKDASIVVWVVEHARPEHASAIEWLNNNVQGKGFYLVEIEVWKIGDSNPAPKFNIVEKPNTFIQVQKAPQDSTSQFKYEFWREFIEYSKTDKALLKAFPGTESRTPSGDHWFSFFKGCKGDFVLEAKIFTRNSKLKSIAVDVWISNNKEQYQKFLAHRDEINNEIGVELEWDCKDEHKASSIRWKKDVNEDAQFVDSFRELSDMLLKMQPVFNKYA